MTNTDGFREVYRKVTEDLGLGISNPIDSGYPLSEYDVVRNQYFDSILIINKVK